MKEIKSYIARIAVAAVLVVTPFYCENGYFNTLAAKAHIFWVIAAATVAAFALVTLLQALRSPQTLSEEWNQFRHSFGMMDAAVAVFGITALLSSFCSDYMMQALTGSSGWQMGGITLALLSAMYFVVSRYAVPDVFLWPYVALPATIEYVLGYLNGLGIDPLGMHAALSDSEQFKYIGTVGNINTYSAYLVLTLALLTMVWITDRRRWMHIWSGILLLIGYTNLYMNNSDGAWLGICIAMLFLIYYCLQDRRKYDCLLQAGILFAAAGLLVQFGTHFLSDSHVEFEDVPAFVLKYHLYLAVGIICLILLLLKPLLERVTNPKTDRRLSIVFGAAAVIAVAVVVIGCIVVFDESWGKNRGYIWTQAINLFASGSIKDKLIGIGPDCFSIPMMEQYGDYIVEHLGKRLANTHNESIQYLVTTGVVGAVSYLGIYLSAWRGYVKRINWNETRAALFVAIMGYAGQAVVNNPQAMNMAFLFVFLGLFRNENMTADPLAEIVRKPVGSARKSSRAVRKQTKASRRTNRRKKK